MTMTEEPTVAKGGRRTLEQQLAQAQAKTARIKSRLAIKNLAHDEAGKRVLQSIKRLAWIGANPEGIDSRLFSIVARAHDQLVTGLATTYDIDARFITGEKGEEEPEEGEDEGADETGPETDPLG